jgi:hypothetical protein
MIKAEIVNKETITDSLQIPLDRADEIVREIRSREIPTNSVSNVMKWACFTEQLNNLNERVFALYIIGGDAFRHLTIDKLRGDGERRDEI